jgi:hypothetical protein
MSEPIDNTEPASSTSLEMPGLTIQAEAAASEPVDVAEPTEQPEATTPAPLDMSDLMDIEPASATPLNISDSTDKPPISSEPLDVLEPVTDSNAAALALPNISEPANNVEEISSAPPNNLELADSSRAPSASFEVTDPIENPEILSSAPHITSEPTENDETTVSIATAVPTTDPIAVNDPTVLQEALRVIQTIEVPPVQTTNSETEAAPTQTTLSLGSMSLNANQLEVLSAIETRLSSTTRPSRRRGYRSAPPVPDPKWHYHVARMVALFSVHDDGWEPFEAIVYSEF